MVTVTVKAKTPVFDNGVRHSPGDVFQMEHSLVKPHVDAGQAEIVAAKQQATPRDKQATGGRNKGV